MQEAWPRRGAAAGSRWWERGLAARTDRACLLDVIRGVGRVSYSLGLQVGAAAGGAAVVCGPRIDLLALPGGSSSAQWSGPAEPGRAEGRVLAAPATADA